MLPLVVRVVPDVTGLDRQFDYLVPEAMRARIAVGSMVRVSLHGRRVGAWVVEVDPAEQPLPVERLSPVAKWSGVGPDQSILDLARWASVRWGVGRLRPFLVSASPPTMVAGVPPPSRRVPPQAGDARDRVVRLPPAVDPSATLLELARRGPLLAIHPAAHAVQRLAEGLHAVGLTTAIVPEQWARAAGGVDVVIGGRQAVWAPCPDLRTVVVVDEHDEALQEERSPTWHARDVAIERARRVKATCVLLSPCPSPEAVHWTGGHVQRLSIDDERAGWPIVEVVDRSDDEPWKRSLLSSQLIRWLRDPTKTVVCVLNTKGRARLVACRSCRRIQRCERCEAAVVERQTGQFDCLRCGTVRPVVCQACGSTAMALVRAGVTRLGEELSAAAGRDVGVVTADTEVVPRTTAWVGTESVLHRVDRADLVAFLDFDSELLAPRFRAAQQAMALLCRGARLLGPRSAGGRLLVQTTLPHHEVVQAALLADPGRAVRRDLERREMLGLPPFAALAAVAGAGASEFAAATGLEAAVDDDVVLLRAPTWEELGQVLVGTPRPKGSRLRIEVDPRR